MDFPSRSALEDGSKLRQPSATKATSHPSKRLKTHLSCKGGLPEEWGAVT